MKPITLLLLTSSLLVAASGAFAQQGDACSNQYGACMDRCSARPQSVQGPCAQTCEQTSDQCYVGVYGPRPPEGQALAPSPASEARDAQGSAATGEQKH